MENEITRILSIIKWIKNVSDDLNSVVRQNWNKPHYKLRFYYGCQNTEIAQIIYWD